jgi:arylsulfatase A-like enzyme
VLAAWCGIVAGLLEVLTIVVRKQVFDPDQLFKLSRHFVWLIPLANVVVLLAIGLLGLGLRAVWPRAGRWLLPRVLCACTLLPAILIAFPRIYAVAWFFVALGLANGAVPIFERRASQFRRAVAVSLPVAIAAVAFMGASLWLGDRSRQARENAQALPPKNSPNVLLVVMDTVAAGHLSLHGYNRSTSVTLAELADHGIRFDRARATSSWTLPSHASMFTGHWLHDLSVGWLTPLDRSRQTLAEFLGKRGYATAGFIANTFYCATDSGLARGFTSYRDYIFPELTFLKHAVVVNRALEGFQTVVYFVEDWLESAGLMPAVERFWSALDTNRKGAATVNRELLNWLGTRPQPDRPFFAFLNYYDAHYPYQLAPGRLHRFGVEPTENYQRVLIQHWWDIDKATLSPDGIAFARDLYDDCIADLDEQLGKLVDQLNARGVLENTWLFVVSDHGESFGEHAGVFCHGMSLYETEVHVPLVIVPPGGRKSPLVISEPVSLRDLAATIVDSVGVQGDTTFPGHSLARFWDPAPVVPPSEKPAMARTLAEVVPNNPRKRDYFGLPLPLPPMGAIKAQDWSYIRHEGESREELFQLSKDAKELRNVAADPTAQSILEEMRKALDTATGGPLLPQRFRP